MLRDCMLLSPHSHNNPPAIPPLLFSSKSDVLLKMQRTGAYAWLYATAFFALSIAQATFATSQVVSPYLLGLGESFSVNSIQGRDLSRLLPSVMVLQELAISLGNDISTFIMHILRPFCPDRSGNTRFRPVVETNMMVRFQFFDLHIVLVLFRISGFSAYSLHDIEHWNSGLQRRLFSPA
jgi:hypothetical protein